MFNKETKRLIARHAQKLINQARFDAETKSIKLTKFSL